MTESSLPDAWSGPVAEAGLDAKSIEPPADETGDWFDVYSHFATRGFVRMTLGRREDGTGLQVQMALPTDSYGPQRLLEAVCAEFEETVGGTWSVREIDPDWELAGELDASPEEADVAAYLRRLEDLSAVADADDLGEAPWLRERLEGSSPSDEEADDSETGLASEPPEQSASGPDVFESIGDSEPDTHRPTPMLEEAGLAAYEIAASDDGLDIRFGLDVELPTSDLEELGRAVAHALRARYDLDVRPLPADDEHPSLGASNVALRAEPTDLGVAQQTSPREMQSQVDKYFDRLQRFDNLGVKLADVLGMSEEANQSYDRRPARRRDQASDVRDPSDDREPSRGTTGASPERRDREDRGDRGNDDRRDGRGATSKRSSETSRREPSPEEDGDSGVVLDIGNESSSESAAPTGELEAGNYRDPRLLREDATTSLVDVVLRHPGYAEEKMAHNLSILLSVDYPEAMDLVESAPCVIAWGVGHDRGDKFKRVIERAGGRAVLLEPDSLSE